MRPECRAEMELHAGKGEELHPQSASEDRVSVAHNGARKPVESDDVVEESLGDGEGRVRVAQGNEVDHLGETIHHHDHDRLAADLGEPLHEVHRDVAPHGRWRTSRG